MNDSAIISLLEEFSSHERVIVEKRTSSHCVRVVKQTEYVAEVLVPHDRLEWFVTILDPVTNQQILHDWMDHYSSAGQPASEPDLEMRSEIVHFVRTILSNPTRLKAKSPRLLGLFGIKKRVLQYKIDDNWKILVPFQVSD